ncbi:MAG: OsmC family peroxiredoxin, partial [Desulfuromonadales bacterium]
EKHQVVPAAARGITIESVESTHEGDLDARAFLELSDEERKGYQNIRATFRVKSDASAEELQEMAEFSPVLDVVNHRTQVILQVEKT